MLRVTALVLFTLLAPLAARAAEAAPACAKDLLAVQASFDETAARLQAAQSADHAEKCAALHHHIDVMMSCRDVFLRCRPPGAERDADLAQLATSITDFQTILKRQKCP